MANYKRKQFSVHHTRINRSTTIVNISKDEFNPMTLIVDFDYTLPENYYIDESDIIYAKYLDREYLGEFKEKKTKIQLENFNTVHILEIFAHPHPGYQFIRDRIIPGNKIRIRFRGRNPDVIDITKYKIFWDNATGTYLDKIMGEVDAETGNVTGRHLKSGRIVQ